MSVHHANSPSDRKFDFAAVKLIIPPKQDESMGRPPWETLDAYLARKTAAYNPKRWMRYHTFPSALDKGRENQFF
jgi:hypothetical protein